MKNEKAVVFGAGSGVGRATALALAARGTKVLAVGRDRAKLEALGAGFEILAGDATDPAVCERALAGDPDLVVVSLGIRPPMAPVDEMSWDDFSATWNGDLKASFHIGQVALRRPLRAGSTVVIVSSGAGLGGSPLSGGYSGAKRMQMFLASYLQRQSERAARGVRFVSLAPKQLLVGTVTGDHAAARYAAEAGMTVAEYMRRFEAPLDAAGVAAGILRIADGDAPAGAILAITGARGLEAL
jgi:NAD(P)-dependent dehydrogenase (short-subunit alcohol dehydrogenase family)